MSLVRDNETLDDLQLKGIHVIQKKDGFRFGVDAVLLSNFANIKRNGTVVDLCTGTGIIPFILSGKSSAKSIVGVEIQEEFAEMANRSSQYNNLEDKVKFINGDLKDKQLLKQIGNVDVVTVNPPYKLFQSGLVNPNTKEAIARHEVECTLEDVIIAAKTLLKDSGRVFMVHRPDRLADIFCTMRKHKIEPKRVCMVYPVEGRAANIVLVEGQKHGGTFLKWERPLTVRTKDGDYTDDIKKIYTEGKTLKDIL